MGTVSKLRPKEKKVENEIRSFIHCGECIKSLPPDTSPREYQQLEIGWTEQGIQIWCRRHNLNVMHMDFEGRKHPAE